MDSSRITRTTVIALIALVLATLVAGPVVAASPSPTPQANPNIAITARALLGGHVRPGAWTAVDVEITNSGPAVSGELRIAGQTTTTSQYGIVVELATNAHQRLTLYAQTAIFGSRVNVELVSGDQVLAAVQVPVKSHDSYSPVVAVVAEKPEGLLQQVTAAMANPNVPTPTIITIGPADLPQRVEAWAAVDRLIWQDVDAAQLTETQAYALRLWLGAGGRLTVLGGTTGTTSIRGFDLPDDAILPFDPQHTIDAAPMDIAPMVGQLPTNAATIPAIGGTLRNGTVLARSGDDVIAAETAYGRGTITLVGFDPATSWIREGEAASALWHRLLPQISGPALNPLVLQDDSQIVVALQNLPSVDLPPIEQLFVLLLAYIALIGPINYLILRRLDKREWAWVTIPALVVVFAAGSYGMGATLKGSDVIVNEVGVVRAAEGSTVGIGQVYIGIYSPTRRTFQVSIPGGALISNPTSQAQFGQTETPLDVLFGRAASHLRNFEVGFGVLRGFRAEAPAAAPDIESDLTFSRGLLQGTVKNNSDTALENVAIVFGGDVAVLPALAAGESRTIELDTTTFSFFGYSLSEKIFGSTFSRDQATARKISTRRAVIDQVFNYGTVPPGDQPLLLAWRSGAVLEVELSGEEPNRVGDALYMIPLAMALDAEQVFTDQAMRRSIVAANGNQAWGDVSGLYLSRGTLTLETRPVTFTGQLNVTSLDLAVTQGDTRALGSDNELLEPLPADEQPDQDDPLNTGAAIDCAVPPCDDTPTPDPNGGGGGIPVPEIPPVKPGDDVPGRMPFGLPALQLFDRTTQLWVEFESLTPSQGYSIANPERYVDSGGAVLYRFVNRAEGGEFGEEQIYFQLLSRIAGTIQ
jgi:hypothetical protein